MNNDNIRKPDKVIKERLFDQNIIYSQPQPQLQPHLQLRKGSNKHKRFQEDNTNKQQEEEAKILADSREQAEKDEMKNYLLQIKEMEKKEKEREKKEKKDKKEKKEREKKEKEEEKKEKERENEMQREKMEQQKEQEKEEEKEKRMKILNKLIARIENVNNVNEDYTILRNVLQDYISCKIEKAYLESNEYNKVMGILDEFYVKPKSRNRKTAIEENVYNLLISILVDI